MINRYYYKEKIEKFLKTQPDKILGVLSRNPEFSHEPGQRYAWQEEINILQKILSDYKGNIYFEYSIPRMGKRIDVLLIIENVLFILEFKVGEKKYPAYAIDQVYDYALDLKNFHEASHENYVAPILISTKAPEPKSAVVTTPQNDKLLEPVLSNVYTLKETINTVLKFADGDWIDVDDWDNSRYCPTPTIIEAAKVLYKGHNVTNISKSDASAINLSKTTEAIEEIIKQSKETQKKSICFVTGVPGAGKTLVGLNIANRNQDSSQKLVSVFLSGNKPLVDVLTEALARDRYNQAQKSKEKITKKQARSQVKAFIQIIHHFRDHYLIKPNEVPVDHVVLFDEAQRAWDLPKTTDFMKRKKGCPDFNASEPEFLISCMDRHKDWAVIVCLVGGGQEIHSGEAGISEWINALNDSFPDWNIFVSSQITDSEYGAGKAVEKIKKHKNIEFQDDLHLSVSMRSFRAENVSLFVKQLLDLDQGSASGTLKKLKDNYPIVLTRDLNKAKQWLKNNARGTERYGLVVSSQAERLKPHAIDVRSPMNPINWFLDGKDDVRSSYYLESIATEFDIQGLELDWACVVWDADFRYCEEGWKNWSFRGNKWQRIMKPERKLYQKNAYRVLLTRARQGMVIVVPPGDKDDTTRDPGFYDDTFGYLMKVGFDVI